MRFRSALPVLAALLLAAGIAGASPAPTASSSATPAISAGASLTAATAALDESRACGLSSATLASGLTPAPSPLSGGATCGSCSRSPCQGAVIGTGCYANGHFGYCQSPLGNNCSDGITWQCQCWYGPLP